MPVFISYSHEDKEFVEQLAFQLVAHRANVWLDKWELSVGDSIINKIQDAIKTASALLIILSRSSVESEWCKKELTSGLLRELEERRVVVLPIVIDDCEIPLFLRDKLYADFRTNKDEAFVMVLQSIAKVTSDSLGRLTSPEFFVDWATDWGFHKNGRFFLRIILVEQGEDQPITCLSEIMIIANEEATKKYFETSKKHNDRFARLEVIESLSSSIEKGLEIRMRLDDNHEKRSEYKISDGDNSYLVIVSSRRLGEDTGKDVLLSIDAQILGMRDTLRGILQKG